MLCCVRKVHDIGKDKGNRTCDKYLLVHAKVICHGASNENSCANADVPTAEICAVGCAALVVACEVYAHGLVAGEYEPKACADEECRQEKCNGAMAKGENEVRDDVQCHPRADKVDQITAVNESPCHDAVHDEPAGDERIKPACAADAEFVCINGDVVCYRAVGKSYEYEVRELRNGTREEESIE